MRRLYILGWVMVAVMWHGFLATIVAAGIEDGRSDGLVHLGVAVFFLSGSYTFVMGWWSDKAPQPNPRRLPRAARKTFKKEQARIQLEIAIKQAEEEAGLR